MHQLYGHKDPILEMCLFFSSLENMFSWKIVDDCEYLDTNGKSYVIFYYHLNFPGRKGLITMKFPIFQEAKECIWRETNTIHYGSLVGHKLVGVGILNAASL